MKKLIVFLVLSFSALAGNAQLIIDSVGRVGIMTGDLELKSRLTVGNPTYAYNASIGVASSPIVRNKNNIGVVGLHYGGAGVFGANSTYYYNNPINIQEAYAGYFVGPVNVTSNALPTRPVRSPSLQASFIARFTSTTMYPLSFTVIQSLIFCKI